MSNAITKAGIHYLNGLYRKPYGVFATGIVSPARRGKQVVIIVFGQHIVTHHTTNPLECTRNDVAFSSTTLEATVN